MSSWLLIDTGRVHFVHADIRETLWTIAFDKDSLDREALLAGASALLNAECGACVAELVQR